MAPGGLEEASPGGGVRISEALSEGPGPHIGELIVSVLERFPRAVYYKPSWNDMGMLKAILGKIARL